MAVLAPPALQLSGLTKRYDSGLLALDRFDLDVPAGDTVQWAPGEEQEVDLVASEAMR